ncbi:MAG: type II toxin-antitoxin system RelE/ParE family toxin [Lachnospiraceae bacterium]|nr:type II toxin-antitoxin system RelE/ParE family toxin [Lachnospiraceae bacterium]
MDYNVIITCDAENDLEEYVRYLLFEKRNEQAAGNLLDDFEDTVQVLTGVAESLKLCENPKLREQGYRRINLQKHRYFMLYRVEENDAIVDALFHELQDYENKMK